MSCFSIQAYENRNMLSCFAITIDAVYATIQAGDLVRVQIGFDTVLTIESGTPTPNGSTVTKTNPVRLTLVSADLNVATGVYDIDVDLYEASTGEYKRVISGVLVVGESVGSSCILSTADILTSLQCTTMTSSQNAMMMQLRNLVENAIKSELRYNPCFASHVEYYPIQRVRQPNVRLQLKNIPLRTISEIVIDEEAYGGQAPLAFTAANGAETLVQGEGFYMNASATDSNSNLFSESGILTKVDGYWPCIPGTIKVTYDAGWTAAEFRGEGDYHSAGVIKRAAMNAFVASFRELLTQSETFASSTPGLISSETIGDYSYSLDAATVAMSNFTATLPVSVINSLYLHRHYGLLGI